MRVNGCSCLRRRSVLRGTICKAGLFPATFSTKFFHSLHAYRYPWPLPFYTTFRGLDLGGKQKLVRFSFLHTLYFSSRWHRSARKGPYALHPVSQQSPQGCPRNSANICLVTGQDESLCTGLKPFKLGILLLL